jgi:hypothetical protein
MKKNSLLLFAMLFAVIAFSQNLDQIGIKKGIKVNGSVNLNTVGYQAKGIAQRRDPFNWFATGNLSINLFGYSAPFSFSYGNANKSFSQPFNQFSFSPNYKWVKTYIGYSTMTFSNYTMAGHLFLGGGMELTPGKWRIAAMYGRLKKAAPFDPNDPQVYAASFKRMGYGVKVGYESNGDVLSANLFTARDEVNSIPFIIPESNLTPMQNVAISLLGRKRFLQRFFVEAEYAVSALNKDTRANAAERIDTAVFKPTHNLVKGLLPENSTSRYYDALQANVGYQGNLYSLQLKYERIAPEYQTLGAYYFNNDLRNLTIAPSLRLFENKLNLVANVGLQRNNLDNEKTSTTERTVGSVNANYVPNEFWNFAANYSNFTSFTNVKPQPDPFFQNTPLDTLNFYQLSQTMSGNVMRNLGTKDKPQSIMLNVSYQKAGDKALYAGGNRQQSEFINLNVAYSYAIVPANASLSIAGNIYKNTASGIETTYWGPTVSITKALYAKRLRASLSSSYNETSGTVKTSPVLNDRLSLNYSPKPKEAGGMSRHSLALGINYSNRLKNTEQQSKYSELTGTFNYTYAF